MGFADDVKGKAEAFGDKAEDVIDSATDKAEDALDVVKDKASEVVGNLKETFDTDGDGETSFGEVVETVKTKAGELFEGVKDKVSGDGDDATALTSDAPPDSVDAAPPVATNPTVPVVDDAVGSGDEPVEDFAAAGPAAPESSAGTIDAIQEEAEELERNSEPGVV